MLFLFSFDFDSNFSCNNGFLRYFVKLSAPVFLNFCPISASCFLYAIQNLWILLDHYIVEET